MEEPDYFAGMEPVVSSAPKLIIQFHDAPLEECEGQRKTAVSNRFAVNADEHESVNVGPTS